MDATWNRENYEASVTRTYFSSTIACGVCWRGCGTLTFILPADKLGLILNPRIQGSIR